MQKNTEIDTRRYYLSTLKQPKGWGGWLFENDAGEVVFKHTGSWADARKAAAKSGLPRLHACS